MKIRGKIKKVWIVALVATVLVCWFSTRLKSTADDFYFREYVEEPITFKRLALYAICPARYTHAKNACINNLRQIDGAIQQWALQNNATAETKVTWNDIRPYLSNGDGTRPWCPMGGVYLIHTVADRPTCSHPGHSINY